MGDEIGQLREHVEREFGALRGDISAVRKEVADHRAETRPMVEAMQTMEAGIRTIGRVGRLGEKFGRLILFFVACGVIFKFVFGGASWADVSAAIARVLGK